MKGWKAGGTEVLVWKGKGEVGCGGGVPCQVSNKYKWNLHQDTIRVKYKPRRIKDQL